VSASLESAFEDGQRLAVPWPVVYARVLLAVQACLWGVVTVGGMVALAVNARGIISGHGAPPHGVGAFVVDVVLLAVAAAMTAVSALVMVGLERRRAGARVAGLALECLMTCFGFYLALRSVGGFLAGGGGAVLSGAAVACLLGRPARRFTRPAVLQR
jgi:hypothetical protein